MYPDKIRDLVVKHRKRGLSYRKIADLLDISLRAKRAGLQPANKECSPLLG